MVNRIGAWAICNRLCRSPVPGPHPNSYLDLATPSGYSPTARPHNPTGRGYNGTLAKVRAALTSLPSCPCPCPCLLLYCRQASLILGSLIANYPARAEWVDSNHWLSHWGCPFSHIDALLSNVKQMRLAAHNLTRRLPCFTLPCLAVPAGLPCQLASTLGPEARQDFTI